MSQTSEHTQQSSLRMLTHGVSAGSDAGALLWSLDEAARQLGNVSVQIKDFTFHDLRHTCAAWLVSSGASLIEVRDLLGHSTIKMTECYSHLAPDNVRVAVSRLDERSRFGHVAA